jgi:hypothetical protein
VWPEFDVVAEHQLAHRLLCSSCECLTHLRRVDPTNANAKKLLFCRQYLDCVAIWNTYGSPVDDVLSPDVRRSALKLPRLSGNGVVGGGLATCRTPKACARSQLGSVSRPHSAERSARPGS